MSAIDRVLILGAHGQLGQALAEEFASCNTCWLGTRRSPKPRGGMRVFADLAEADHTRELIARLRPEVIVNAAAYTAVDGAESEPDVARAINADAVAMLGEAARDCAARLVHFSTDYVFGGTATKPYTETDATEPVNAYGASKLAGEQALVDSGCEFLILRTSWLYAARGHNFLRTMLHLATQRSVLEIVDDQRGAPTWTGMLAQITHRCLEGGLRGVYHAAARGETTWYGFAAEIFRTARELELLSSTPKLVPVTTAGYPRPAHRPAYSVLDCTRLETALGVRFTEWGESLRQCLTQHRDASVNHCQKQNTTC